MKSITSATLPQPRKPRLSIAGLRDQLHGAEQLLASNSEQMEAQRATIADQSQRLLELSSQMDQKDARLRDVEEMLLEDNEKMIKWANELGNLERKLDRANEHIATLGASSPVPLASKKGTMKVIIAAHDTFYVIHPVADGWRFIKPNGTAYDVTEAALDTLDCSCPHSVHTRHHCKHAKMIKALWNLTNTQSAPKCEEVSHG